MLTRKGLLTAGMGVIAFALGLAVSSPLAVLFALFLAGMLLAAQLQGTNVNLAVDRVLSQDAIAENGVVNVRLRIHNRGKRAFFELQDALPETVLLDRASHYALLDLEPGEVVELRYAVRCPLRGRLQLGPVNLRIEDVFGLVSRDTTVALRSELRVYPATEDLKSALAKSKYPRIISGDHQVGQPGAGYEFFALREYAVGDSIRDIDWKASARSKGLVVRQRERESYAVATVFVDARGISGTGTRLHNPLAFTCRAAASIVSFLLDRRDRTLVLLYGTDAAEIKPGPPDRTMPQLLDALMDVEGQGTLSLADVVERFLPSIKRKTAVFLISSLLADAGIGRAIRSLRSIECRVVVVSPDVAKLLPEAEGASSMRLLALGRGQALEELQSYGAIVVDWDPRDPLGVAMMRGVAR